MGEQGSLWPEPKKDVDVAPLKPQGKIAATPRVEVLGSLPISRKVEREPQAGAKLPCLALTQPWASLLVMGRKRIETRSWPTRYRGRLAVQAAKGWTKDDREFARDLGLDPTKLPLGAIVGVVELVDCVPMTDAWIADVTEAERELGGYAPGRFGWICTKPVELVRPVPLRGRLGIFDVAAVDADAAAEVERQFAEIGDDDTGCDECGAGPDEPCDSTCYTKTGDRLDEETVAAPPIAPEIFATLPEGVGDPVGRKTHDALEAKAGKIVECTIFRRTPEGLEEWTRVPEGWRRELRK